MEKLWTLTIVIVGILALFNIAGITSTTGYLLQAGLTSPETLADFWDTSFWNKLHTIILSLAAVGIGGAILVGVFTKFDPLPLTAIFAASFSYVIVGDMVSIVNQINSESSWGGTILYLLIAPLLFGYVLSLWDWIRGHD